MFTKVEPLENAKHQELRLSKSQNFGFAKTISSVQLSFSEIQQASNHYPIIFPADGSCIPTALLSLKEGENKFIDELGQWKVPYIPVFFRLYPFTLAKIENEDDKYALCIDRDAEHFSAGQGEPLFTADGESNEFVQGILKTLKVYQNELATTKALFTLLAEKELIVDRKVDFQINGEPKSIDGFKGVDMEKLLTLDDETIAGFVKNGTLPLVYNHLQSLSNIASLVENVAV